MCHLSTIFELIDQSITFITGKNQPAGSKKASLVGLAAGYISR